MRYRVKKADPGLVRVEFRLKPSEKALLASRANKSRVSLAELLRQMTRIELHEENPYSAGAYLAMASAEDKEMERRERARVR